MGPLHLGIFLEQGKRRGCIGLSSEKWVIEGWEASLFDSSVDLKNCGGYRESSREEKKDTVELSLKGD